MAKRSKAEADQLTMCRADNGDWSIHPPARHIKQGEVAPTLVSGPAYKTDKGDWDRPDQRDLDLARMMWQHHRATKGATEGL